MSIKHTRGVAGDTGNNYFNDYTTTNLYVELSFGFPAQMISIINDSDTDPVQVSFDGSTLHYGLDGAEFKDLPAAGKTSVFIKATTGGEKARVNAV